MSGVDDLEIEYVTHASLLLRTSAVNLLLDPFSRSSSHTARPSRPHVRLARLALSPDKEYLLYMAVMLTLFMDLDHPHIAELGSVVEALCG